MIFSYHIQKVHTKVYTCGCVFVVHDHITEILLNCYLNVHLSTRYVALTGAEKILSVIFETHIIILSRSCAFCQLV